MYSLHNIHILGHYNSRYFFQIFDLRIEDVIKLMFLDDDPESSIKKKIEKKY